MEALKRVLEDLSGKTLIYVNSKKALNFLKSEGLAALEFEDKSKTEQLIHQFYEKEDVLVVCTTEVKEGINLNEVSNIIWYQTPKHAVDFTQCNGRMLRGIPQEDTHKQVIQKIYRLKTLDAQPYWEALKNCPNFKIYFLTHAEAVDKLEALLNGKYFQDISCTKPNEIHEIEGRTMTKQSKIIEQHNPSPKDNASTDKYVFE